MGQGRSASFRWIAVVAALLLAACDGTAPREPLVVADISMSIAELEDLRQANPEQTDIGLVLGERYRRLGQLDDAQQAFQRVFDAPGATPELQAQALGGLALTAQSRDDLTGAEALLLQALNVAENASLVDVAHEQRERLAVLERVRGDFVAACGWYDRAGQRGSETQLTATLTCEPPDEVLALAGSIWRAHASATMEGLVVESRQTKLFADQAELAAANGALDPEVLAPVLGDYSRLVLYTEGPEAAEAVARRAVALDPGRARLQLHLISPLILQGREGEADAAVEAVLGDWLGSERSGRAPDQVLMEEFFELGEAGLYRPHMNDVRRAFTEHRASFYR